MSTDNSINVENLQLAEDTVDLALATEDSPGAAAETIMTSTLCQAEKETASCQSAGNVDELLCRIEELAVEVDQMLNNGPPVDLKLIEQGYNVLVKKQRDILILWHEKEDHDNIMSAMRYAAERAEKEQFFKHVEEKVIRLCDALKSWQPNDVKTTYLALMQEIFPFEELAERSEGPPAVAYELPSLNSKKIQFLMARISAIAKTLAKVIIFKPQANHKLTSSDLDLNLKLEEFYNKKLSEWDLFHYLFTKVGIDLLYKTIAENKVKIRNSDSMKRELCGRILLAFEFLPSDVADIELPFVCLDFHKQLTLLESGNLPHGETTRNEKTSPEKKRPKACQSIEELEQENLYLKQRIHGVVMNLKKTKSIIRENFSKFMCRRCGINPVGYLLLPCLHASLCEICSSVMSRCFVCDLVYDRKEKLNVPISM